MCISSERIHTQKYGHNIIQFNGTDKNVCAAPKGIKLLLEKLNSFAINHFSLRTQRASEKKAIDLHCLLMSLCVCDGLCAATNMIMFSLIPRALFPVWLLFFACGSDYCCFEHIGIDKNEISSFWPCNFRCEILISEISIINVISNGRFGLFPILWSVRG